MILGQGMANNPGAATVAPINRIAMVFAVGPAVWLSDYGEIDNKRENRF
jgi:hypothetical protein